MPAAIALGLALIVLAQPLPVQAEGEALARLSRYVSIDTTNPPGNESRGVAFFAAILEEHGIAYETAESAPGRGNLWARLEGGDEPALVLLHHMDVVPASPATWTTNPLEAVRSGGFLHGRGTLDTKSLGIMHLEAFLALHASGAPLVRDVVFMATADEEAGGQLGAGWLVEERPELFEDVGFLLNEGGRTQSGEPVRVGIEVGQKVPVWLRLVARDTPGHGSVPRSSSAPRRLVAALERLERSPFPPRVLPAVRAMFASLAQTAAPEWREPLSHIDDAIRQPGFLERLQAEKPRWHALLRDTCSLTVLAGSSKINVVPPEARAELDCRVLPDRDVDAFVEAIRERVDDDSIRIETLLSFGAATSSSDTDLFRLLAEVARSHHPGAHVFPGVATGFTDSHFFRDLGITSYGFFPAAVDEADFKGVHGDDERIGVESFARGVEIMTEVVERFATR